MAVLLLWALIILKLEWAPDARAGGNRPGPVGSDGRLAEGKDWASSLGDSPSTGVAGESSHSVGCKSRRLIDLLIESQSKEGLPPASCQSNSWPVKS